MFNQYGIMAVNTEKYKHVKYKEAMEFINWLISREGQQAIASFKDKNGNPHLYPEHEVREKPTGGGWQYIIGLMSPILIIL